MFDIVSGALRVSLVTFVLCGFAYPFAVTVLGQLFAPFQAHGSLVTNAPGVVVGSRLIGQNWTDPKWFHGRPSATTDTDPNDSMKTIPAPYNAASSSASNLGPTSKALQDRLAYDRKALEGAEPSLAGKALPADVLTTSGSGLDPDITPANANSQIERVAKARGVAPNQIAALVARHTTSRSLGIFGEPRVNVLELNLELEKAFPAREMPQHRRRLHLRRPLRPPSRRQRLHRSLRRHRLRRCRSIRPRTRRQNRLRPPGEWRRLYSPHKFLLPMLAKSQPWPALKPVPNSITRTPRPTPMVA
jgi:potassium-transporting ATPase KdpC subunit